MIKVIKSPNIPSSLTTTKAYDGEDVKIQLLTDQKQKCYLCERNLVTDFEIEHLNSKEGRHDWNNLFLACRYCNSKKSNNYNNILNPLIENIEEVIRHEIKDNQAIFTSHKNNEQTINLLNSIHNGVSNLRKIKEEQFFEYLKSQISNFSSLVLKYLYDKSDNNKIAITEELSEDKEFLGFKYWIICSNSDLKQEFSANIVWNK